MAPQTHYRQLDAGRIVIALSQLHARICERFPRSGLQEVCAELLEISRVSERKVRVITGPYVWLRLLVSLALAGGVAGVLLTAAAVRGSDFVLRSELLTLAQGLESVVNLVILSGAAAWFLLSLEERLRRRRVLQALHELRSIAHVIDMHQLTKDPTAFEGPRTKSSPHRAMTRFELTRYLDYCVEMLALAAKLAALYGGASRDPVVMAGVNDIETLTGTLTRSIWQKLIILSEDPSSPGRAVRPAAIEPKPA